MQSSSSKASQHHSWLSAQTRVPRSREVTNRPSAGGHGGPAPVQSPSHPAVPAGTVGTA